MDQDITNYLIALAEDTEAKWRHKAQQWNDHEENKRMGRRVRMNHPAAPNKDNSFGSAKYRQSQGYTQ
jgi:hypothetical protein